MKQRIIDITCVLTQTKYLLLLVILVGTIIRFWNYFNMPFTYDEMSALNRTGFSSFSDLIHQGVKVDAHPPLIQVFLNYWVAIFGKVEWIVKLPFVLMGIASLGLTYGIGKKWFNESVGLIASSFLTIMQFSVMYSLIARPYISGMFLLLMMVYYWSHLIQNPQEKYWKNWTLTLLFATLCAYNHHFSLLAAGIIGVTGLFLANKKETLKYVLLLPAGFLLFLPNLSIFLYQLNIGGVGAWLGPPTPSFIWDFLQYIFHYSWWILLILLIVVVIGIKFFKKSDFKFQKWMLAGIWFFSVFLIGYFYSVHVNPVLQFSMLLFLFPFLLFFIFGWIPKLESKWNGVVVLLILTVGTTSLICERNHFQVFEQNRYFQMKADAMELGNENTEIIFVNYKELIKHPYPKDFVLDSTVMIWQSDVYNLKDLERKIMSSNKQQLMIGYLEQMPKEILTIAQAYFPYVQEQRCYHGATTYLFSKEKTGNELDLVYFQNSFSEKSITNFMNFNESNYNNGKYIDSNEWSLGQVLPLSGLIEHKYDVIVVKAKIKLSDNSTPVTLVGNVVGKDKEKSIFWAGQSSNDFYIDENGNVTIHLAIDYNTISNELLEDCEISTYIWNQGQQKIEIKDISFEIWRCNRNKYMIFEKIK